MRRLVHSLITTLAFTSVSFAREAKPNILFIAVDEWVGCHGHTQAQTYLADRWFNSTDETFSQFAAFDLDLGKDGEELLLPGEIHELTMSRDRLVESDPVAWDHLHAIPEEHGFTGTYAGIKKN